MSRVDHLGPFPVIEFRRYTIKAGEGETFATYFDAYFPEAFEHAGSLILGQFLERADETTFTWLRGFRSMDERASVNTAFYTGPLWKEHAATMNERILDIENVLLLQPLDTDHGVAVLPAVDPVNEPDGAAGVVVAHVFKVAEGGLRTLTTDTFEDYRAAGAREVGWLVTLDAENNFPALPFRTDGPFAVWFGLVPGEAELAPLSDAGNATAGALLDSGVISAAELVVLDPTPRSRLRWRA